MVYQVGKKGQVAFVRVQGAWNIEYREVVLEKYKKPLFAKKPVTAVVARNGQKFEVRVHELFEAPEKFVYN